MTGVAGRWHTGSMDRPRRRVTALLASLPLLAACSATPEDADPSPAPAESSSSPSTSESESPSEEPTEEPDGGAHRGAHRGGGPPPNPISIAALADAELTGGDLRLGAVRERTSAYTSYDVTYRSTTAGAGTAPLRISGVLNVPTGRAPRGQDGRPWCSPTATSTRPTTSAARG